MNGAADAETVSRVRVLGEFELGMADGSTVAFDSARAESLLAYLVLHRGESQSRERLSYLLWPTSTEQQARTNLRHLLHTVRRALPAADRVLEVTAHRERLFDAVVRALTASGRTVLLVADDMQYFDRFSLRLLHFLLRVEPAARVLVVATARPEDIDHDHPVQVMLSALQVLDQLTTMELSPLSRDESAALASRLIESALPDGDLSRLIADSEGNPLFLIESLRAGLSPGGVSPKVQAVIAARPAKLSEPARDLIGLGCRAEPVIGDLADLLVCEVVRAARGERAQRPGRQPLRTGRGASLGGALVPARGGRGRGTARQCRGGAAARSRHRTPAPAAGRSRPRHP